MCILSVLNHLHRFNPLLKTMHCSEMFLSIDGDCVAGRVRDGDVSVPGADHLSGAGPHAAWGHRRAPVPLHSRREFLTHTHTCAVREHRRAS